MSNETRNQTSSSMPPSLPLPGGRVKAGNLLAALLKAPAAVAGAMAEEQGAGTAGFLFLVWALLFHAIFGFAVGLFGGWRVGSVAAVKAPLIALASWLLCFPSLYVFSSVGGPGLSIPQTFMLGSSCLAMVGLLLIALAPVAWLFAVSTESLPFVVMLVLFIWLISVIFAARYVRKLKTHAAFHRTGGVAFWFLVFMLVSLQMVTCMRPVLTTPAPERGWWTTDKKFFLAHFASCFEKSKVPAGQRAEGGKK
jgi:hypothetical protein